MSKSILDSNIQTDTVGQTEKKRREMMNKSLTSSNRGSN